MAIVYANIGSNLGNCRENILTVLCRISEVFGICCISDFIETEPWGFESANRFLNLGVSFKTKLDPEKVLENLQEIEKSFCPTSHRDSQGNYCDRMIDIDIMAIDEIIYRSERLMVPHPHLLKRDFFLIPLKQLAPGWKYPGE